MRSIWVTLQTIDGLTFRRDHLPHARRAEHTMGMPATESRRWTPDDVRQLMRDSQSRWPRYEFIDGELLMTPAPGMSHYRALIGLFRIIDPYVLHEGVGEACLSPADLELRKQTISQPDLFVAPRDQVRTFKRWQDVTGVTLCVEVLSPGSAAYDRGRKRVHYQKSGIAEYWIVDTDARLVERWRPMDERPEIIRDQLLWHPAGAATPLTVDLAALFAAAATD
jgi:Uma2 family endonuclease